MNRDDLNRHLRQHAVIALRTHPEAADAVHTGQKAGLVTRLLPGTYVLSDQVDHLAVRASAIAAWCPDAVLLGEAAAALTYWPDLRPGVIEVAANRRACYRKVSVSRRRIDPEWIVTDGRLRCTAPALTALDLAESTDGCSIDQFLRSHAGRISDLRRAIDAAPHRRGNKARRRFLLESRAEPWSIAERHLHALLHAAGITGWRSNLPIWLQGRRRYLDVAFDEPRVAIEFDGWEHHREGTRFVDDRRRQNALVLTGWLVLRFTWPDLCDRPQDVVEEIKEAVGGGRSATRRR